MKLDEWLTQEPTQADRLRVVERLAQAINETHGRGEPLAALEPSRIEVASDLACELTAARRGTPPPAYVAPERADGGPPSPESDVYVAGRIFWEILAGRAPGPTPAHLAETRPELAKELSDAIMACLERSAEWRPKDLTYVAQLAQEAQVSRGAERARTSSTPRAGVAARSATRTPSFRTATRRESRSQLPLAIAVVVVLAAAGGSYYWLRLQGNDDGARPAATRPSPGQPATRPLATATPGPGATPQSLASATPTPAAAAGPAATVAPPTPAAAPTPTPRTVSVPSAEPATPVTLPTPVASAPRTAPAPPDAPASTTATTTSTATTAPPAAAGTNLPSEPPIAATISPLTARRPGKVLFDVRGSSLHSALRARVIPLRQAAQGITVVRQKCADATLVSVLLDFDATVAPGAYALVLEDATGRQTKPLTFSVVK